jgi:hypothetical protein
MVSFSLSRPDGKGGLAVAVRLNIAYGEVPSAEGDTGLILWNRSFYSEVHKREVGYTEDAEEWARGLAVAYQGNGWHVTMHETQTAPMAAVAPAPVVTPTASNAPRPPGQLNAAPGHEDTGYIDLGPPKEETVTLHEPDIGRFGRPPLIPALIVLPIICVLAGVIGGVIAGIAKGPPLAAVALIVFFAVFNVSKGTRKRRLRRLPRLFWLLVAACIAAGSAYAGAVVVPQTFKSRTVKKKIAFYGSAAHRLPPLTYVLGVKTFTDPKTKVSFTLKKGIVTIRDPKHKLAAGPVSVTCATYLTRPFFWRAKAPWVAVKLVPQGAPPPIQPTCALMASNTIITVVIEL